MTLHTDDEGYMTGIGSHTPEQYHADPCNHPSLSAHTAMRLLECPDDVRRTHPRLVPEGYLPRRSKALDKGSLVDQLLTGSMYSPGERKEWRAPSGSSRPVQWERFGGLVIIHADDYRTAGAQALRDMAHSEGMVPVLGPDFEKHIRKSIDYLARLELAGVSFADVATQVPVYWVETCAATGTKVQCRALLDMLDAAAGVITDLKTAEKLSDKYLARSIHAYRYHVQGAAYIRGVYATMADENPFPPTFRLAFLRTELVAARCMQLGNDWEQMGSLLWERAVSVWAECLSSNDWPGYEQAAHAPVMEPYMLAADKQQIGEDWDA